MPNKDVRKGSDWGKIKFLVLFLPIAVHFLIQYGYLLAALVLLYFSLLAALSVPLRASPGRLFAVAAAVAAAAAGGYFWHREGNFALYLPSVLIPLVFFGVFAVSLLPGHTPLVTQIAVAVRGRLPHSLEVYTRRVTMGWCGLALLLALEAWALALWSPVETWSLFTNVLNYLIIFAFFVLEFLYRKWFVKEADPLSFIQYIRALPQAAMSRK